MKILKRNGRRMEVWLSALLLLAIFSFSLYFASATPQGSTVSFQAQDLGPNKSAESRTDPGGRIITANLNMEQQDGAWKAYIGNVTGSFVLQNVNNVSIYEWPLTTVDGEVYLSRNGSLNFGSVACATQAQIDVEHALFGMVVSDADSLNSTFNASNHASFDVGTTSVSGCPSTALWVNDTLQIQGSSSIWQEVLLNIGGSLTYATVLNNDKSGFDNNTYDFQVIVAENRSDSTGHAYYFYLELGN